MTEQSAVSFRKAQKLFKRVHVLYDIDLDIQPGEVHAFVGENGAGKSTLGKIIAGFHNLSEGQLSINGKVVKHWDPISAQKNGVVMMHQELSLVPQLTVSQNIFLGIESARSGVLKGEGQERFHNLNKLCQFKLEPTALVGSLSIANQQKVEIMRSLARDVKVIVMDEPTASLTIDETEHLHEVIKWLKETGCTVIYITHFLEHVLEQADRLTVLRNGRAIRTAFTKDEDKSSIVEAMLGQKASGLYPQKRALVSEESNPALEVLNLSTSTGLSDVSISVNSGEIVGLLGLVGSGRTEMARAIFGADSIAGGQIILGGSPYDHPSPQNSIAQGIAMIPENRRDQGLLLKQNVRFNITLPSIGQFIRAGVVNRKLEYEKVKPLINRLGVVPSHVNGNVGNYSGGNQQKVLFAKWLISDPGVLILDEPTRGVDIGAKRKIYHLISELAAEGKAILLISSEFEEVLGLAQRAYLLKDGKCIGEVKTNDTSVDEVLKKLFGVT